MKYYQDFLPSQQSFNERVGVADEFDAAVGRVALGFSFLEDTASNMIAMLAGCDAVVGCIVTAELSLRQKLNELSSLIKQVLPTLVAPEHRTVIEDQTDELLAICWRSEELRNTYLHSTYAREERVKITAKAKHGLRMQSEAVHAGLLLDVADFIVYSGMELESLPMMLNMADQSSAGDDYVSYSRSGAIVRTFRFGEFKQT